MTCSKCGHENRTGAKYCEECGAHLASMCANCGAQLSPNYIMGQAKDLRLGIDMAREVIVNGRALEKLRAWVRWQNAKPDDGLLILEERIRRAA